MALLREALLKLSPPSREPDWLTAERGSKLQEAFAKLAIDAATAGNSDIAKKSLAAIQSDSVRGDSAYKCAMLLAKAGQGDDAIAIAKSLVSDNQREKALSKIANGDFGD